MHIYVLKNDEKMSFIKKNHNSIGKIRKDLNHKITISRRRSKKWHIHMKDGHYTQEMSN